MHRSFCPVVVLGHTGHGKSTLVDALASLWSTLPTRASIDVRVLRGATTMKRYGVLDVPGGRWSLRAAMRAMSVADVAVLVVSSRQGPQALTREHLLAAQAANLGAFIVVINDIDGRSDPALLTACEHEIRAVLADHGAAGDDATIVIGDLHEDGAAVANAVLTALDAAPQRACDGEGAAVFRPLFTHSTLSVVARAADGAGHVVASGRMVAGTMRVGDVVNVVGQRAAAADWRGTRDRSSVLRATVMRLRRDDVDVDSVGAGEHCGVQLAFARMLGSVDRFSTVASTSTSTSHHEPVPVIIARLAVRPAAIGGPRCGLRAATDGRVWIGAAAITAAILPLDDAGDVVTIDDVGSRASFLSVLVFHVGRFAEIGGLVAITASSGVLAYGVVIDLVVEPREQLRWRQRAATIVAHHRQLDVVRGRL